MAGKKKTNDIVCDSCGHRRAASKEYPIHIINGWRLCLRCWGKAMRILKVHLRLP